MLGISKFKNVCLSLFPEFNLITKQLNNYLLSPFFDVSEIICKLNSNEWNMKILSNKKRVFLIIKWQIITLFQLGVLNLL